MDGLPDKPVVVTTSGPVRGARTDGVRRFLGVPYAAGPVGERRFAAPEPHAGWSEPREATTFGPNAPQAVRDFPALDLSPVVGRGWVKGDDYLNVNVWTPEAADRLPVMVFVHGGAFVAGASAPATYDGTAFARDGVVMMSVTYRMGVEGFLPIEGAPTNLGLRDLVFALGWVRDNAAAFGGDPDKVTVFGESAGAMLIADLIASPLAKGLFRRAIVQSGHGSMVRSRSVAERLTRRLAMLMGVAPTLEGFRSRGVEQALEALEKVQQPTARIDLREADGREGAFGLSRFLPVWGDDVLPEPPLAALAKGAGSEVDLLIGANAEEMNIYLVPTGAKAKINTVLAWLVLRASHPRPWRTLLAYGLGRGKAGDVLLAAMHDLVFRLPVRDFAAAHRGRTHLYDFGWRSPQCGGELGACHALELPFVFDTLSTCTGPTGLTGDDPPQALADRIHRTWVGFAKDGTLPWPEYEPATRQVHSLDRDETLSDPVSPAERMRAA